MRLKENTIYMSNEESQQNCDLIDFANNATIEEWQEFTDTTGDFLTEGFIPSPFTPHIVVDYRFDRKEVPTQPRFIAVWRYLKPETEV